MADRELLFILRQGVAVWNKQRWENEGISANLHSMSPPWTNLSSANASAAEEWFLANVLRAHLSVEEEWFLANLLRGDLTRADLTRADLSGMDLTGADLRRADLSGADLSGADLTEATLILSNLIWAVLTEANLTRADLRGTNLTGADLTEATLILSNLIWAVLTEANLTRADLSGADLRRSDLTAANLQMVDLSWANLSWANLSGADLSGADLSEADLSEAALWMADLSEANLSRADLSGADLSEANLSGATLSEANLSGADLRGVNLSGATLTGATLTGAITGELPTRAVPSATLEPEDRKKLNGQLERLWNKWIRKSHNTRQNTYEEMANVLDVAHYGPTFVDRLDISFSHAPKIPKGEQSLFVINFLLPKLRNQLDQILKEIFKERSKDGSYVGAMRVTTLTPGIEVRAELSSPGIMTFTPSEQRELEWDITTFKFLGKPLDNVLPGEHLVLISIKDANSGRNLFDEELPIQIVDYAFDHVSRPMAQRTWAVVMACGAFALWSLGLLEQIDKTIGLTAGTAAAALSAWLLVGFQRAYKAIETTIFDKQP